MYLLLLYSDDRNFEDVENMSYGLFTCVCSQTYDSENLYKRHRTNCESIKCHYCNVLVDKYEMYRHMLLRHREMKRYKCHLCEYIATNQMKYVNHLNVQHDNPNVKKPKHLSVFKKNCSSCCHNFYSEEDFRHHLKDCTNGYKKKENVSYVCEICGHLFASLQSVKRHRTIHDDVKNCVCQKCGKCFRTLRNLDRHLRTHSNSRPFKCEDCDKCFRDKSHLTRHRMGHTGRKPYKCELCNKECIQKCNLKRHRCNPSGD